MKARAKRLIFGTFLLAVLIASCGLFPGRERSNRRSGGGGAGLSSISSDDAKAQNLTCDGAAQDPGRVTLRRLSKFEYNNTVRDVLGINLRPADKFQDEALSHGFDNIATSMSVNPTSIAAYLAAAESMAPDASKRYMCNPATLPAETCARQVFSTALPKLYRRPPTEAEINRLVGLVKVANGQGDSVEAGIQLAMQAALLSPNFLYRIETDLDPNNAKTIKKLNSYELASRLSYFIWSSAPDDELLKLAASGGLNQDDALRTQVTRMLKDPKSQALIDGFGELWLGVRKLDNVTLDATKYPAFTPAIKEAMKKETKMFFQNIKDKNLSFTELLTADYTFANADLARYYGLPAVTGDFTKVPLDPSTQRRGYLTQGTFLIANSKPSTTHPIERGKFVLDQFWCLEPPPPPPDATSSNVPAQGATKKEILKSHRESGSSCKGCHVLMDPIGLGFENFDANALWRTLDGNAKIDPSGELPNGSTFADHLDLIDILPQKADYSRCVATKLTTYAVGRITESADTCAIKNVMQQTDASKQQFAEMINAVVLSPMFRYRRGEGEAK